MPDEVKQSQPPRLVRVMMLEESRNGLDTSSAGEHGEVVIVFGVGVKRPSLFAPNEYGVNLLKRLEELHFDSTKDRLLLAGSLLATSLALGVMMTRWPSIHILLFSATEGKYVARTLDSEELAWAEA